MLYETFNSIKESFGTDYYVDNENVKCLIYKMLNVCYYVSVENALKQRYFYDNMLNVINYVCKI